MRSKRPEPNVLPVLTDPQKEIGTFGLIAIYSITKHDALPPTPTSSAPFSQGDALIAYENLKREKKCGGRKTVMKQCDIKVISNGVIGRS